MLDRHRETAADHLEQFRYAESRGRHAGQHRMERAAGHGRLQVLDDGVETDLFAGQVPVEQPVVLGFGDHRLDQVVPGSGDALSFRLVSGPRVGAVHEDVLRKQADQARRTAGRIVGHREVERVDTVAEGELAVLHGGIEIAARLVDVRDHHGPGHADVGAFLPEHPGGSVDRPTGRGVGRGDHEQGGVRGPEAGPQLPDEIGVAGGVDQVDPHLGRGATGPDRRGESAGNRQRHRSADATFHILEIADSGAVLDGAGPADRAGGGQDRLHQHRLAGAARADQHHIADPVGRIVASCHRRHLGRPPAQRRWPQRSGRKR